MENRAVAVKVPNREGIAQGMQKALTDHGCLT
jgi:hypothetical protein